MRKQMLQRYAPRGCLIETGEQHSVREFVAVATGFLGMEFAWKGKVAWEKGLDKNGNVIVALGPRKYRPTGVETLLRDAGKAMRELGWKPRHIR